LNRSEARREKNSRMGKSARFCAVPFLISVENPLPSAQLQRLQLVEFFAVQGAKVNLHEHADAACAAPVRADDRINLRGSEQRNKQAQPQQSFFNCSHAVS